MAATLASAMAAIAIDDVWTNIATVLTSGVVVGLVATGLALKYGRKILRFVKGT
ncbi:MAG TPA: hypothetical protein V6C97_27195 [Oculatellaceae cyanobacterium]